MVGIKGLKIEYEVIKYQLSAEYQRILGSIPKGVVYPVEQGKKCYVHTVRGVLVVIPVEVSREGIRVKTDAGEVLTIDFKHFIDKNDLITILSEIDTKKMIKL